MSRRRSRGGSSRLCASWLPWHRTRLRTSQPFWPITQSLWLRGLVRVQALRACALRAFERKGCGGAKSMGA